MTELTRDWERQVRVGARAIWGRGYNETLTAIIKAARMAEKGDEVTIYVQRPNWSDWWWTEDNANLRRAYDTDALGLLDLSLTYGVWIYNATTEWEYKYEAEAATTAAPLFAETA